MKLILKEKTVSPQFLHNVKQYSMVPQQDKNLIQKGCIMNDYLSAKKEEKNMVP